MNESILNNICVRTYILTNWRNLKIWLRRRHHSFKLLTFRTNFSLDEWFTHSISRSLVSQLLIVYAHIYRNCFKNRIGKLNRINWLHCRGFKIPVWKIFYLRLSNSLIYYRIIIRNLLRGNISTCSHSRKYNRILFRTTS